MTFSSKETYFDVNENVLLEHLRAITSDISEFLFINTFDIEDYIINLEFSDYFSTPTHFEREITKKEFYSSNYFKKILLSLSTLNKFNKELVKKSRLVDGKKEKYREAFNYLMQAILPLNPLNISPKITGTDSIYIKFLLDNRYLVRIELFLWNEGSFDPSINNIVITLDENDEQIFGARCSAEEAIKYLFSQIKDLPTVQDLNNTSDITLSTDPFEEEQSNYSTSF